MKILKSIAVLFLVTALSSCHNDDDNNNVPADLIGNWRLVSVSGTIAGTVETIPDGAVVWDFSNNSTVTIANNYEGENYYGPASGTYPYDFVNSDAPNLCAQKLSVNNTQSGGCVSFSEGKMYISDGYADGVTWEFAPNFTTN